MSPGSIPTPGHREFLKDALRRRRLGRHLSSQRRKEGHSTHFSLVQILFCGWILAMPYRTVKVQNLGRLDT